MFHVNLTPFEKNIFSYVPSLNTCMQKNEETFAKYAFDANLFQLGSINPEEKYPGPGCFWWGVSPSPKNTSSDWDYFLGLMDPSWNRLASTIFKNCLPGYTLHMHQNQTIIFFKFT